MMTYQTKMKSWEYSMNNGKTGCYKANIYETQLTDSNKCICHFVQKKLFIRLLEIKLRPLFSNIFLTLSLVIISENLQILYFRYRIKSLFTKITHTIDNIALQSNDNTFFAFMTVSLA